MAEEQKSLSDFMIEQMGGTPVDDPVGFEDDAEPQPQDPQTPEPVAPVKAAKVESAPIPDDLFGEPKAPDPEDEVEKIVGANEKEGLKNLRHAYKDLKNQWQQAQQRMQELEEASKKAGRGTEETERLRREAEAMSLELEKVALERHPRFQAQFKAREDALNAMLSRIKVDGMSTDDLAQIIRNPDPAKMNEIAEQVSPYEYGNILNVATRFSELNAEKQAALSNHRETLSALQQQELQAKEKAALQQKQQFSQLVETEGSSFEFMRELEGNEAWNGRVSAMKQQAQHLFFSESDPRKLMRASMLAVMAEPYREAYIAIRGQLKEAQAQIDAMKASNPSVPSGSYGGGGGAQTQADDEDFGSFINRQVAGAH